jgi:hypothetical protein
MMVGILNIFSTYDKNLENSLINLFPQFVFPGWPDGQRLSLRQGQRGPRHREELSLRRRGRQMQVLFCQNFVSKLCTTGQDVKNG